MKHRLTIIALLLALCVSLYFVNSKSYAAPAPQAWEYKLITGKAYDVKKLNAAGADGWELTACAAGLDACIFKRPK